MPRPLILLILAIASCAATGCVVGPDHRVPNTEIREAWREADPAELTTANISAATQDLMGWWMQFEDPVLNGLIDEATANNEGVIESYYRIVEARANRGITRADRLPTFDTDGSYTFTKTATSGGLFGQLGSGFGAIDTTIDSWSYGLNGSWELDFFGRVRRLIEAADADICATVWDYRDTLVILTADLATNYVDARTFQQRLEIARSNLQSQEQSLELTEKRFNAGLTSELDVAQARANLHSTQAEIPTLEIGYRQAVNRVSVLLGRAPGHVDELLATVGPIPVPAGEIAVGIPADLLTRRPDIRSAEKSLAAANARIGAAEADFYPKISISGSFGLDAQDLSQIFKPNAIGANVGPAARWNVMDYGRIRFNIQVQEARTSQAAARYRSSVLQAAEEVDNGIMAYTHEQQRAEFLGQAADATRRSVDLSQKQYTQGTSSFQRVLDSQRSQLQVEDQLAVSNSNVTKNLIQLYRSLGGGWQAVNYESLAAPDEVFVEDGPAGE
jgi:multidrug efflux system outer membrane protein